jgi:hypothetical protein
VRNTARSLAPEAVTAADVKEIVRSVLLQCAVPFTEVTVTSTPSAWTVIVNDQSGLIFRLPVHAGPRRIVHQAVLEAIEAEW